MNREQLLDLKRKFDYNVGVLRESIEIQLGCIESLINLTQKYADTNEWYKIHNSNITTSKLKINQE